MVPAFPRSPSLSPSSIRCIKFSVTSFGHSRRFSDKLWTLSQFEWQIVDILPLSQWQVVDILPITQWQVVDTLSFFSAINCEDYEIKAKIRVENQLFYTFHCAHHIPEAFLHGICRNSFLCDSPFKFNFVSYLRKNVNKNSPGRNLKVKGITVKWMHFCISVRA